jgi:DNA-binding CsgD family transcriptional regulator
VEVDGQEVEPESDLIGREPELAALHAFLSASGSSRKLLLTGEAGIGKTTIWETGIDIAGENGFRVMSARPSEAETRLSFAALADLLDRVDLDDALRSLPTPQRQALEVALLRSEPGRVRPEPRAIVTGFLSVLRILAARDRLLLAIDDVQWLDRPSADALAFAVRRLESSEPIWLMLSKRSGTESSVEQALSRTSAQRLELGGLSLGGIRRVLRQQQELSLSRRSLHQVFTTSAGNPFFALELGRSVATHRLRGDDDAPVPARVEDMLNVRIAKLAEPSRVALMAVSLSADLRLAQLEQVAGQLGVDEALESGLLVVDVDVDRVRVSHPLLAAAARSRARPEERRALHRALADVVTDTERRASHLALAAEQPDADLAELVSAAASDAAARGATAGALALDRHALRLTPASSELRSGRVLALAERLFYSALYDEASALLEAEVNNLPPGASRGRGHLLLGMSSPHLEEHARRTELAFAECGDDKGLRARVLVQRQTLAFVRLERCREAEEWAVKALELADRDDLPLRREAIWALGWARILRGHPVADLHEALGQTGPDTGEMYWSLDRIGAIQHAFRGEVEQARAAFTRLLALAAESGAESVYNSLRLQLCELALRAGEVADAAVHIDEWAETNVHAGHHTGLTRCQALLAAVRGLSAEAEQHATAAIAGASSNVLAWDHLEATRARGIAALLAGEPARAAESLGEVWEHTQREEIDDPGAFPAAPDLVEALCELGELPEAIAVGDRLRKLSVAQEHPWGLATSKRCDALIRLASDPDDGARDDLQAAAAAYGSLGLRFDRARCLLALGRAERRGKKWAAARDSLERATAAFDEIGSVGWAEQASSELARVGARKPQPKGKLTGAEERTATLAAQGLANKEIAATLHVSVHTVEVHLSHAYAKLDIRSRSQLAAKLPTKA